MSSERKVAVITGASQGMGAALVEAYRHLDYGVVATARSIGPSNDDQVLMVPGDITDRKTAERAISEGVARFGRIDTLINNAGVFVAKPFTQYTRLITRLCWASTSRASFTSRNSPSPRWRSGVAATSCRSSFVEGIPLRAAFHSATKRTEERGCAGSRKRLTAADLQFTGDDFFIDKDVCSIVLEMPKSALGAKRVGLWARTLDGAGGVWVQADRRGTPLAPAARPGPPGPKPHLRHPVCAPISQLVWLQGQTWAFPARCCTRPCR